MNENPFSPEPELPTDDTTPRETSARTEPAWERRDELGTTTALLQTFSGILFRPSATFQRMRTEPRLGAPILFVVIPSFLSFLLSSAIQQIQAPILSTLLGIEPSTGISPSYFVIWLPAIVFALFFKGLLYHLMLMLVGGNQAGFPATFRVVAYVAGSMALFTWIPCLGAFLSLFWGTYLEIVGLKQIHGTSGGRALLAVLVPMVFLVIACGAVLMAVFLPGVLGGFSGPPSAIEI